MNSNSPPDLALVRGCTELPLPQCNDLQVTQASSGPGLFFHANISNAGLRIERAVSVAAHKLGWGPCAATERIVEVFGDGIQRQTKLDELYDVIKASDSNSHFEKTLNLDKLRSDCKALAKYAHDPSETPDTRIQAFKGIILVITRYPSIRHFFPSLNTAPTVNEDKFDADWRHLSDFARFCMSNDDIFKVVEQCCPSDLAILASMDRTVIETLQSIAIHSERLEKLVAIRCLAGILDLPSFWNNSVKERLLQLVGKLCEAATRFIGDIGVESEDILTRRLVCDVDGINLLCHAILAGVQGSCEIIDAIKSYNSQLNQSALEHPLPHPLVGLIDLLTSSIASTLFQESHCLARALKDMFGKTNKGQKDYTTNGDERIKIKVETKMRPDASQPVLSLFKNPSRPRWDRQVKQGDATIKGTENDIVVPVMGPTGVGKSTFINNFMDKSVVRVGHHLKSCTAQLEPVFWPITEPAHLKGRRLVLVDTPGFDDTYTSDAEILRRIGVWLASSYDSGMPLGGIIYLHNISNPRLLGSDRQSLEVFQELCGSKAFSSVIIGLTKSGDISPELSEIRCNKFSSYHWNQMIKGGATVYKLGNDNPSARIMITNLLQNVKPTTATFVPVQAVEIQSEIVDLSKLIPETKAGKRLKATLTKALEMQKKLALEAENDIERQKEYREAVNKLNTQIKALKIPFLHRLRAIFGLA